MVAVQKKKEAQGLLLHAAPVRPIHMRQGAKNALAGSSADGPRELPHGVGCQRGLGVKLGLPGSIHLWLRHGGGRRAPLRHILPPLALHGLCGRVGTRET